MAVVTSATLCNPAEASGRKLILEKKERTLTSKTSQIKALIKSILPFIQQLMWNKELLAKNRMKGLEGGDLSRERCLG